MKKILLSFVAICSIFMLTACGSNKIIGTWNGKTEDGLETTFTFKKKDVVTYKNSYGFSSEGTYTIKDDVVTISLKLWDSSLEYKFEIKNKKLSLTPTDKNKYAPSYKDMIKK